MSGGEDLLPGTLEVCTDYAGRTVVLTEERWEHILDGHPVMEGLEMALMRAVENADIKRRGNGNRVEILYGRNLGPTRWLAVVVAYDKRHRGTILTGYPMARDPKDSERI